MSSFYQRGAEKRRSWQEMRLREQEVGSCPPRPMSPKNQPDQEKRMRREIANSNERRRMQSINAGFQSLKTRIPHNEGEKLSKAAILQHTSDYIYQLEQSKAEVLAENSHLKEMLRELGKNPQQELRNHTSPPPKRKKRDTESSDEGIGLACGDSDDHAALDDMKRAVLELRGQLELERKRRMLLEEKSRVLETQIKQEVCEEKCTKDGDVLMTKWDKETEIEAAQHVPRPSTTPSPPSKDASPISPFLTEVHSVNNCLSLSRRNLDTIVEAIRHLEGDTVLMDYREGRSVPMSCTKTSRIPNSEESGTESSFDHEDSRSEASSGRDSPSLTQMECESSLPSELQPCVSVDVVHRSHHLAHHQKEYLQSSMTPLHVSEYTDSTGADQNALPLQFLNTVTSCPTAPVALHLPQLITQPGVIVKRS